jgi:RimJ/RimL family protein N-acetyltransferase
MATGPPAYSIRPIAPGDREALAAAFQRLSPESRYLRFFAPVSHLSAAQLDYLTEVDHHDHEALLAVDGVSGEIVGVARYVRTDAGVAEPAVVVGDAWQGQGIGSRLLDALAARAREEGVRSFAAVVLAHNDAALAALRHLGESETVSQGQQVELHIDLGAPEQAAFTLHHLLRRAAEQSIRPAVSFLHRLSVGEQAREGPPANAIVAADDASLPRARELAAALGASLHVVQRGRGDLAATLIEAALEHRARMIVVDGSAPAGERFAFVAWDHVAHHAPCDVLVSR